jgi:hypothetical protein
MPPLAIAKRRLCWLNNFSIKAIRTPSAVFLGWAKGKLGRHIYVRQLKDMKIGAQNEFF